MLEGSTVKVAEGAAAGGGAGAGGGGAAAFFLHAPTITAISNRTPKTTYRCDRLFIASSPRFCMLQRQFQYYPACSLSNKSSSGLSCGKQRRSAWIACRRRQILSRRRCRTRRRRRRRNRSAASSSRSEHQ